MQNIKGTGKHKETYMGEDWIKYHIRLLSNRVIGDVSSSWREGYCLLSYLLQSVAWAEEFRLVSFHVGFGDAVYLAR